jgi:hypothetical protein
MRDPRKDPRMHDRWQVKRGLRREVMGTESIGIIVITRGLGRILTIELMDRRMWMHWTRTATYLGGAETGGEG